MSRIVLNKLLAHSLENYQILYSDLRFHIHNAHHLGSLYLLGASNSKLEKTYEAMCEGLEPYEASPQEINLSNWRKFLGNKHYCKSYRDFFHQQLTTNGNDWHKKFTEFLLDNKEQPMINGVIGGLAHPLIHIGYAFELDNELVAIEALAMTAVCYNYLHETVDKLKPPTSPSKSPLQIFKDIHSNKQLPVYDAPDLDKLEKTNKDYHDHILSHYNQWKINTDNIEKTIEELFDLAVYMYGATHKPNQILFDFFLLHLLTSMHAIRIIHSHINNQEIFQHILYQFFYFAILIYIVQLRPEINEHFINDYKLDNEKNTWDYVIDRTLNTKLVEDAHLVKVVRALRDAEQVYGTKNAFYLKTAVKTVDNAHSDFPWILGSDDEQQLNILKS